MSEDNADVEHPGSAILKLPPEIIHNILSHLGVQDLVAVRSVCHDFKVHSELEQLWVDLLRLHIPAVDFPSDPSPASSYRNLYLSHSPRWHLPGHRLWFSDDAYNGKLILIKYDPRRGSIEGYRLTAERPEPIPQIWSFKPSVIIHYIEPRVYASTDDPVLSLPLCLPVSRDGLPGQATRTRTSRSDSLTNANSPFSEVRMSIGRREQRINASLMLSRDLPGATASSPSVDVWPPRTIPNMPRTRASTSSSDHFTSKGHRPQSHAQISQTTFRMRTWTQFTQGLLNLGVRLGEEVTTWSTLDRQLYTPTATKPYQGIYVGDYATHGCEFLLVMQTEKAPQFRRSSEELLANVNDVGDDNAFGARRRNYIAAILAPLHIADEDLSSMGEVVESKESSIVHAPVIEVTPNVADPDGVIHRGAIEAVKLTGDVNVPRGEHTFIADDIGPNGTIRVAGEHPFTGARVVKCRGHVAARGFRDDEYIKSQLFLIDENTLAQYWLPFGHISFYRRVDIDDLSAQALRVRRDSE